MWWQIYYADGSTFSSEQGSPFDAPRTGVEVIVHEEIGGGFSLLSGADFYYWEPEASNWGWMYADQFSLVLHLQRAKAPLVLFGEMIRHEQFTEMEKRALADVGKLKKAWRRKQDKQTLGNKVPA